VATQLGFVLAKQGKLPEAVQSYRRALALDPGSAEAHAYLGSALASEAQWDEAITHFEQALAARPENAELHDWLGVALREKGRQEEALPHFREAVRLEPGLAIAHYNLGRALKQQGKLDEAVQHYRRALALNPRLAGAHNSLGRFSAREQLGRRCASSTRPFASSRPTPGPEQPRPRAAPVETDEAAPICGKRFKRAPVARPGRSRGSSRPIDPSVAAARTCGWRARSGATGAAGPRFDITAAYAAVWLGAPPPPRGRPWHSWARVNGRGRTTSRGGAPGPATVPG
jgi:tetratricopeptide (TPR) repeat protein